VTIDLPLRLVVADNDQAVIDLVVLDLGLEGHEIVATAMNGEDAVRLCQELAPDVLVVDYRLGRGINGIEVARQVRGGPRRVVLFTNYVNPAVVSEAADAGAVVIEKGNLSALRRAVTS